MDVTGREPPMKNTSRVRSLGTLERWFTLMDAHRTNHFSIIAQLAGRSHPSQWRSALDQLQRRHPLLRVSIHWYDDGDCEFVHCDTPIVLDIFKREPPKHWKDEAIRQLRDRFNIEEGPLIKVSVLHDEERCDIIIVVHHAIADGLSVTRLMRDLIEAVSGSQLHELGSPAPQGEKLASCTLSENADCHMVKSAGSAPPPKRFELRSQSNPEVSIDNVQLSRSETCQLILKAREEKTTVHAAILAALVLAGRKLSTSWAESAVEGFTPISLRKRLLIDADCVVALSASGTLLNPKTDSSLWELAREAKEQLRPQETMQGIKRSLEYFELATAKNANSEGVARSASHSLGFKLMLTNLGKLSFETDTPGLTLEALWGPVINLGFEDEQTVSAATVNGTLFLTHTSLSPICRLLSHAVALLVEASQNPSK